MSLSFEDYREMTTRIMASALDPGQWDETLRALSCKVGGFPLHIFGADTARVTSFGHFSFGYDPSYLKPYEEYYAERNTWLPGFMRAAPGVPTYSSQMCSDGVLERTEFYNDWVKPQGDIMAGGGAILKRTETSMFVLGGNIWRKKRDRLEDEWISTVGQLVGPLSQAWNIGVTLAEGAFERAILRKAKDTDPALIVTDYSGRIRFSNEIANGLIASGDLLRVDPAGRIAFRHNEAQRALSQMRLGVYGPNANDVYQGPLGSEMKVALSVIDASALCDWWAVDFLGLNEPGFLVVISRQERPRDPVSILFSKGILSKAEAEVAIELLRGRAPKEIAELRQVSIHTVRNQIKSGMEKYDARRQSQFVSFLYRDLENHFASGDALTSR